MHIIAALLVLAIFGLGIYLYQANHRGRCIDEQPAGSGGEEVRERTRREPLRALLRSYSSGSVVKYSG